MPEYRRMDAPGGTFFLTWVTHERRPLFSHPPVVERLRAAVARVKRDRPFELHAAVVLPDHLHFLWELPPGDEDFSTRVSLIKTTLTRSLGELPWDEPALSRSRRRHRERGIWQRRFWEHTIRDERDFEAHMDYIHFNPVKHGLATCPHVWPNSSFHRWVERGAYAADWCCLCTGRRHEPPCFRRIEATVGE